MAEISEFKTDEQLFMLLTVLDNIREGVNVVDENGKLIFVNKASAYYAHSDIKDMLGKDIRCYYPKAALLQVLKTKQIQNDVKVEHDDGRKYVVNAIPLMINGRFKGGVATFRDITEIEMLSQKLEKLEMELTLSKGKNTFDAFIGRNGSLKDTVSKAQRAIGALGGPRHCIIVGESGTGKTMLARAMYYFAKKIGVVHEDSPFIEVNCAQFTNPDVAAVEIFGSEKGAFTGAVEKRGLFELADGGIIFLDEAHALEQYQTMLLKAIETGKIRRMGGSKEIGINVIIIAASTKNLKSVFLPELYQRLAQYEIRIPPLRERPFGEKEMILQHFKGNYEKIAQERYQVKLKVNFTNAAKGILLNAYYPRNVRQFRDVVNSSIDAATPLINNIFEGKEIVSLVDVEHIPLDMIDDGGKKQDDGNHTGLEAIKVEADENDEEIIRQIVKELRKKGLGPRKISRILKDKGYDVKYYKIAYMLKKNVI